MQLESARAVPLSIPRLALCALLGTACFHLAYADQRLAFFMLPFLYLLLQFSRAKNSRIAFYAGLFLGIGCYAPHLAFFWRIFGPVAISLWTLLAVGLALFACFHHLATRPCCRGSSRCSRHQFSSPGWNISAVNSGISASRG